MEKRLQEVLNGQEDNYILPFFWQHGEDADTLREYMGAIRSSGIRAVCVESRPHPDYVGSKWWEDMDVILDEAERLGMRVWVLDDAHFPTGYCNGKIKEHPEYGKIFLDHYTIDVVGPEPYASFMLCLEEGESLVAVVAARRRNGKALGNLSDAVDITAYVRGDLVYWPVPEGYWNIIVIKTTPKGNGRKEYANLIDAAAVRFFLDTVYEPHWEHYHDRFGGTFAGFFSDEPELGNTFGEYPNARVGQPIMPLPWCEELSQLTWQTWGENRNLYLAALWSQLDSAGVETAAREVADGRAVVREVGNGKTANGEVAGVDAVEGKVIPAEAVESKKWESAGYETVTAAGSLWETARYEYTQMISDLYGKNFCEQVGDWCAEHGVEYIGHLIEDNGQHSGTGYGASHFFKALWGEHMSGIDVVLQQIRPGYDERDFYHVGGKNPYDGRFFHYGLAKMGVSVARLDEKKQGRTMCEMFGAYGWTEGLKLMKWLADHMLARGVNWFVPHAFTPAPFPDPDCPPHFYAHGMNPQYPWFKKLMEYTNRMSHMISDSVQPVKAAVLYTAELQWLGECDPFEEVGRILAQNLVDYDVAPIGLLETGRLERMQPEMGQPEAMQPEAEQPEMGQPEAMRLETGWQRSETQWQGIVQRETGQAESGQPECSLEHVSQAVRGNADRVILRIGTGRYSALIVPTCEKIPSELAEWIEMAAGEGFPILFAGGQPRIVSSSWVEAEHFPAWRKLLDRKPDAEAAGCGGKAEGCMHLTGMTECSPIYCENSTERLLEAVEALGLREIRGSQPLPYLRYNRFERDGARYLLFFQEDPVKTAGEYLTLPKEYAADEKGTELFWYEPWGNRLLPAQTDEAGRLYLRLEPYETRLLCCLTIQEDEKDAYLCRPLPAPNELAEQVVISGANLVWRMAGRAYDESEYGEETELKSLYNVNGSEADPTFSGVLRYETSFEWDADRLGNQAVLDCGDVYETLEVWLNGKRQQAKIAPPYRLWLNDLKNGENRLTLYVANTLVHRYRDELSMTMPVEAGGLIGPVVICAVRE